MQLVTTEEKLESEVLEGLNDEQKEAVTHGDGPLLIVAGAGTGKTTVITRRIAYLIEQGVKPESILALTFADKAAEEMEERVDQLLPLGYVNVGVSTFHSFGEQILREFGLEIGLPDFKVLNEVSQWLLVRNKLDQFDLKYYKPLGSPTRFIKALVQHFSKAKDEMISPQDYLAYAEKLRLSLDQGESGSGKGRTDEEGERVSEVERIEEVASAYRLYQKLLLDENSLDFGDLINYPLELFGKRPQILKELQKRYQYILVDEFQDTNYAQYELIKALATPKNNIAVVGDDDQSIFKFRGASISNIMHFRDDYKDAKFVTLTKNYRNGQKILDYAYEFIQQNNPDRLEVKLGISKKFTAHQKNEGEVEQIIAPDYTAEAGLVVNKIVELMNQFPELTYNDFAILGRAHNLFEPFISALEDRQIPYIYFANQGLYRKSLVLDILSYFRLLDNYHESEALYRVMKLPIFSLSDETIIEITHFAKKKTISLYEALKISATIPNLESESIPGISKLLSVIEKHTALAREASINQVYREVFEDLEFAREIEKHYQNQRYIEAFSRKIMDFQNLNDDDSLRAFMDQISFERLAGSEGELDFDPEAGPEAVKIMTVHGAKGLEFGNVFMVGLVDKRFPTISRKDQIRLPDELIQDILPEGDAHLEEERRLFYVGMTRSKFKLYLTRAYDYGGKLTKKPSRFLVELGLAELEKSKPTGQVDLKPRTFSKKTIQVPKNFSFSQISTFKKCPLEYKYRYILKIPVKGAGQMSFGLTIHNTLEKFLNRYKQGQTSKDLFGGGGEEYKLPEFETLSKMYEESWVDEWYESGSQKEEYKKAGIQILRDFYEETKLTKPEIKQLEHRFKVKLGEYWFVGVMDRVDQSREGLTIIDYKTGKARKLGQVDKDQLLIYQYAASQIFETRVQDLQYWFLMGELEKVSFQGTEKEIAKVVDKTIKTIEQIVDTVKNDSFYEVDLTTSHRDGCIFRDFEKKVL